MRGTPSCVAGKSLYTGIIPAYAGNTDGLITYGRTRGDHPRVCGEHSTSNRPPDVVSGSSPRMRGTHASFGLSVLPPGIIPAYAGNTPHAPSVIRCHKDHPRVCGEHIKQLVAGFNEQGSSPRMRGTRSSVVRLVQIKGIIPAYAGNTIA